jgi:hypothetical protein
LIFTEKIIKISWSLRAPFLSLYNNKKVVNTVNYWIDKGFECYGDMVVSDRLNQGVDVEIVNTEFDKQLRKQPRAGVYIIVEKVTGRVLKFGQSANVRHRIQTQYKCISNSTNNFIRESIKERFKRVAFFVYLIP